MRGEHVLFEQTAVFFCSIVGAVGAFYVCVCVWVAEGWFGGERRRVFWGVWLVGRGAVVDCIFIFCRVRCCFRCWR